MNKKALIQAMKRSISEVLETMFFLPIDFSGTIKTKELWHPEKNRMAVTQLNFSGPFSGSFTLFIPEPFAVSLTSDFLGKEKNKVSQDNVIDTSKEIINMIAGNTFTILDDHAVFDLEIPEKIPSDQATHSSREREEIFIKIDTTDNYLAVKMVIGQNRKQGDLKRNEKSNDTE